MPEIFLAEVGLIAAKEEATEGTAETPASGDAFLAEDVSYNPEIQMHERNVLRADLSPYGPVPGGRSAILKFKTLLKGNAAGVAPEWAVLFLFCKRSETIVASTSVTYNPISAGDPSGTIVIYIQDTATTGKKYEFRGCRGNGLMNFVDGEPMYIEWEFTAADFTETDSAPLTGMSYDTTSALVFQGAIFTLDSQSFEISKLSLDMGNQVKLREDVNQGSGYLSALITACKPVGSFDPQELLVASYDIFGKWRSGNQRALSVAVGSAGNLITVTAPKVQYTKLTPENRGGVRSLGVDFMMARSTGNDHLVFAFT